MSKAQGQFTIIDYNDALTLTGFINSNHPKTQMFNPDNDTYAPSWVVNNLVLTPSLYVLGTTVDKITSAEVTAVKWYDGASTTPITSAGSYAISGAKSHILTIKANVMAGLPGKDYICEITYKDPATQLSLTHKLSISLSRVVNGGGIVDLIITTPLGNVFKNSEVASLTAAAQLWRGSVIDTTNVTYQWYMMDSSVVADQGGGVGWKKLVDAANSFTGATTATLTVFAAAVSSYGVVKCLAKDTDAASATLNQMFIDIATFIDNSDPLQVEIVSTGGNIFKNGVGSTALTAKVFQAGTEIDTAGTGTYKWSKYDKDGVLVTAYTKTGKTLSVGSADVATKASFVVEVTL